MTSIDQKTADAFATSWNNLSYGSVYSHEQFEEWFAPLTKEAVQHKSVLEMGCGNASLMVHMTKWNPAKLEGVDLGDSVKSAKVNMKETGFVNYNVHKGDLTKFQSEGFDLTYCIGVLHHLKSPHQGFLSVLNNTKSGGSFHCWVYAKEGNTVIIYLVEPLRKICSKLPWWFTKYFVATPLVVPYFLYAKVISKLPFLSFLPLFEYSKWISQRGFSFFRHVAFDQLVTPQTTYISKQTIEKWMQEHSEVEKGSTYAIFRNGNSWKFGGKKK